MKVLWFANTPCGATEYLTGQKVTGGGWLYALSDALCTYTEIELHIAFYWHEAIDSFIHNKIVYHPILREGSGSRLGRYRSRLNRQFSSALDKLEIRRLQKVVEEVAPDLIHFHGSEENFGLLAESIDNKNMLLSIQGLMSPYLYKLYSGYPRAKVLRYGKLLPKLMGDGYAAYERWFRKGAMREQRIMSNVNNIIGRTAWDHDCSLALNPQRKYYVCNEILRPQFFEMSWNNTNVNDKIILVTTVSSGLYKGLEMVYQTARLLKKQNFNFEWNIIGVSANDDIVRITNKITNIFHCDVNVNLLGRMEANDMLHVLLNSHIFIQVSHIENSPNSLCEAMLLGMPIIASFAGGTNSMLNDGKEGILVQDGDPYRLAGAIINMKHNFRKAITMGKASKERAKVRHNPKSVANELMTIYNEVYNAKN